MQSRTLRLTRGLLALMLLSVTFSVGRTEQDTPVDASHPVHNPFTLYSADDGALDWEGMTPAERANTDAVMDWAETRNGATVHNAFSAATARTSEIRRIEDAQNSTNLDGIETLGVVP